MPADHVHFNGSVNLDDAESVMREIASRVPSGLRRIPDGETGDRGNWIFFQFQRFAQLPWLVPARPPGAAEGDYEQVPLLRLADGADPAQVSWPDLGYADAYLRSYQVFATLRQQGVIPAGVRFQVEYPTPMASISAYIVPEQQQALLDSYERAMFADLDRLLAVIPAGEVAVQWDVAVEFGTLEEAFAPGGAQAYDAIIAALTRCVDQVPAGIPVGLHLCYGDYGHQHFMQPESLALQVRVLNAVTAAAGRPVSFVSFTVPQYQREESYFAPLTGLAADPATELNFALVPYHPAEQAPGTTGDQVRLIDAALAPSPGGPRDWGICTECGMGRVSREDIPALLDLHRQIVATR
ncbi:MAG TPA: hypothetical protein VMK84_26490 [Streptosporangiaceae bacterium]|nr:hypothetical protein [Streptosporangiaceae bacterium]